VARAIAAQIARPKQRWPSATAPPLPCQAPARRAEAFEQVVDFVAGNTKAIRTRFRRLGALPHAGRQLVAGWQMARALWSPRTAGGRGRGSCAKIARRASTRHILAEGPGQRDSIVEGGQRHRMALEAF
jgi:hypothetical protein